MSITSLGSLSIGVAVPAAAQANAALLTVGNIAAPNVSAQIASLSGFVAVPLPSLTDMLAMTQALVANIQAAIAAIPPIPILSLSAQVDLANSILATLNAYLSTVNTNLALQATIAGQLATAGVSGYVYAGPINAFGSELGTALGGSGTSCNAIVLLTTSGTTWTAMQAAFKTTP